MIKEFCDKLHGKGHCDDCDNCPIGDLIKEHDAKVRADAIDECIKAIVTLLLKLLKEEQ